MFGFFNAEHVATDQVAQPHHLASSLLGLKGNSLRLDVGNFRGHGSSRVGRKVKDIVVELREGRLVRSFGDLSVWHYPY